MKIFKLLFKEDIKKKENGGDKKKKRANSIMISIGQFKPIGTQDQSFRHD